MVFSPVGVNSGLVHQTEVKIQPFSCFMYCPCCCSYFLNFITQDSPLLSIIKEVGLPKRPPALGREEGRDLSERVLPPRSSSPVIGSPPVTAVPIGTPPKQPMSHILIQRVTQYFLAQTDVAAN